jgi:hypothetical protein
MTILRLLLVLGCACAACAKKPAAKAPAPTPPTTEEKTKAPDAQPTNMPRTAPGDPCSGGETK